MSRRKRKKKKHRHAMAAGKRPTISLCMIVRNEEKYLKQCIQSARKAADEIIVVDTGSEDGTVEIARRLGARIFHHPWNNDFSEARNFSISHATSDWILYLDADEVLTRDACARIRNLTKRSGTMGYILIQRNYTNDSGVAGWRPCETSRPEAGGYAGWFPAPIVRLFRNHPEIRFEGAVHELVDYSISHLEGKIELTDVAIHHYGKVRDLDYIRSKQELYLNLGIEKAAGQPNDAKAHYELGVQYLELGLSEKGIRSLKRSLELNPDQPKAHCDLGVALERCGRLPDAADHYANALKLDPENSQALVNLGAAYARMGRFDEASDLFDRALKLSPNDPIALNNVGSKLFIEGQFEEAAQWYSRAVSLNPSYAQAHFNLGTALEKMGDLPRARSSLEQAAALNPNHHEARANLAVVLMRLGLWKEAEEQCHSALESKPDDCVSHNNLGVIYHQHGRTEQGIEHILTAAGINPAYEPARQNLTQLEQQCPETVASIRRRREAKHVWPRDRMRVVFYHRGMDFDGETILARPLGGSESALVYMARELARLGCEVFMFNSRREPKECEGVRYLPLFEFAGFASTQSIDVFIAQRYWQPFLMNLQSGANIYWIQDAHDQPFVQGLHDGELAERIDRVFSISEWQTRMFQAEFGLPRSKFFVTRNGFCPDLFSENGAVRAPYRLAYASTPFRGLDVLLEIFPRILEAVPDAELHLFTSMAVYGVSEEEDRARYGTLYERAQQPGVKLRGSIPQKALARELQECSLMVYPNHFPETSCIAAIEAQAAGLPVVTSELGALPETVAHRVTGICVPGDGRSPQYRRAFIDETVNLLRNREVLSEMSKSARARAFEHYPWSRIAEEWLAEFERILCKGQQHVLAVSG
ncbi:MAG: tetratricopeptide repeat protein [Candidatus Hydrogenedentota bacterium]|nr:MAG: tetratricopeptide repeat protein [Candidatus Hydrogenedentota bacterium]